MTLETRSPNLSPGAVVRGPLLPEPVEVITAIPMGEFVKLVAKGLKTGRVHDPILNADQLAQLTVSPTTEPFDGDAVRFRLGVEAERLALAYEYDPYFSLSIARVDPLPHQLEAVYEYFLPLPRIRFLLADDPGAGKTIMAGLLLKELKIRGLVQRTLIVAPANLTFQWQREMKDKFRETFEVMRGEILRSQYGQNPWQEKDQVVTSVSWISRIDDAKESLLRSRWDLVIVDEAHKMTAYSHEKKTLAFQLGEALSERTDHYLLMTATPHKGDPENFRLFLSLLDRDVYGDVKSLEEAMRRHEAPFYLRRTKEALVTFPDGQGNVHPLFTNRDVRTAKFDLDGEEYDFYDTLTRYVEDQSMRRLVPEVIEDFFVAAGPIAGVHPSPQRGSRHVYRIGKVPSTLVTLGERLEPRFGRLGRAYQRITFDKAHLDDDPTLEWVTPGHPFFEVVRADVRERVGDDLRRGAVFFDLHSTTPYQVDVFGASIKDGRGNTLRRRLFVMRSDPDGTLSVRQPTLLLDVIPAPKGTAVRAAPDMLARQAVEMALVTRALEPFLAEVSEQRTRENRVVREHMEISLGELIYRQNLQLADLVSKQQARDTTPGLAGNIAQAEQHLDELNRRLETRREQLKMEGHCTIGDVAHVGRTWVLPHPERTSPEVAPMVRDNEVEKIAVREAIRHEEARGWVVESVEAENRGFDLVSRRPHPHDPRTFVEVRFIEVKGRARVGEVALSANEYKTAQRLGADYWLYVVYNCAEVPELHAIHDPARLGWKPVQRVEHYHLGAKEIIEAEGQYE